MIHKIFYQWKYKTNAIKCLDIKCENIQLLVKICTNQVKTGSYLKKEIKHNNLWVTAYMLSHLEIKTI